MKKADNHVSGAGKVDPKIKDILQLLGIGVLLTASITLPGVGLVANEVMKTHRRKQWLESQKEWEKFNTWRLRWVLKRMNSQKLVTISDDGIVSISQKGKERLLQYNIAAMQLKERIDGLWRLIVYDVANLKGQKRRIFQRMLMQLKFLQIQRSVYLTPFICDDEIEYLRQLFDLRDEVVLLKVSGIENVQEYKKYFGIP